MAFDPIHSLRRQWQSAYPDQPVNQSLRVKNPYFFSLFLRRFVQIEVFLPSSYHKTKQKRYPVMYFNDGQEADALLLSEAVKNAKTHAPIIIAIRAANRLQEFGLARYPDFAGRGSRAANYHRFVVTELMPVINWHFRTRVGPAHTAAAGLSLGGLAAFDLAWLHPYIFGHAGVLSGSFWWRGRDLKNGYTDNDRLAHRQIENTPEPPPLNIWLQTGTADETTDRNKNGIIDSIDDTLDLIKVLEAKGFEKNKNIHYLEVEGGTHHPDTWKEVLPSMIETFFKPMA